VDKALKSYLNWERPRLADAEQRVSNVAQRMPLIVAVLAVVALVMGLFLGVVVTRSITGPLAAAVAHVEAVAAGDISRSVPGEYLERGDEIGLLSKAIQRMGASLRDLTKQINGGIQALQSSSAQLSSHSSQMSGGSREASEKSNAVVSAAEQMTANVISVAAGMEQTSANLKMVTSCTEQMMTRSARSRGTRKRHGASPRRRRARRRGSPNR